jgi:hypothetical protein
VVLGDERLVGPVIADAHPLAAAAADREPLEECRTLPGRARPPLGTVRLRVLVQPAQVRLVLVRC